MDYVSIVNHPLIQRFLEQPLRDRLEDFPVVALIGPRQCGKSTLAKKVIREKNAVYLDLEMPSDLNKLTDAEGFLRANQDRLVCLDEIQRHPNLFPLLRALCDISRRPGQYLVLGSSSPELLQQSSETLAGRIAYLDLAPFIISEVGDTGLLHALLDIENANQLFGHPIYGSSWESFSINQIVSVARNWKAFFYRTAKGDEMDLILQKGKCLVAVECKASTAPGVSPGFYRALDDLGLDEGYVVSPLPQKKGYRLGPRAIASTVLEMTELITEMSRS